MSNSTTTEYTNPVTMKSKDNDDKSKEKTNCSVRDHANNISTQRKGEEGVIEEKKSSLTNLLLNNDSISYKKLIIKELEIEDNSDEYNNLINGSNEDFNNFVKIKIIKKTQELEELKSQNLDKLNTLLDKCMKCNKFDSVTLNNIFGHIHADNNEFLDNINSKNKVSFPLGPSKSKMPSNIDKKRKLEISNNNTPQLGSPRGYEPYIVETSSLQKRSNSSHQFNNPINQVNNSTQSYQLPVPEIPSNNQPTVVSSTWQPYADPTIAYSSTGYIANLQSQHIHHQNLPNIDCYASQISQPTQPYSSQAYNIPQNRQYLMVPQQINENLNPVDLNNTYSMENPYYKVSVPHPNIRQQRPLAPPGPQTSPYRQPLPPISKPLKKGHRRTQSASVSFGSYSNNNIEFRSPQTFNNSKPVNFLIHTPKHPPPS